MPRDSDLSHLRRVEEHHKRRCPHCKSNKWEWLGAVPTTPEELMQHLLVHYRCHKCSNEFLVEEAKGARRVDQPVERCIFCHSQRLTKTSRPGADAQIWQCQQCSGYMVLEQPEPPGEKLSGENPLYDGPSGVIIVDE